ncbi:hypothetical protein CARUB_v10011077mg [Capsella rubella]|uniref:Response regulatory domain-containing protein n=1 Tax=Capsella rubella TaxID=81985 RepID=R0IK33_9BRAS|nr:putative two-component response regulator ARR19 [Capsella rubella]EOA37343.1 hypothetical protein CARUB_v10011077mg [Capsella rubella]
MLVGNRSRDEVYTSEFTSLLLNQFPASTNLLIVDSNLAALIYMRNLIKRIGYEVTIEQDAEKALSFLTSCKHDINIVIWEYHMPGINGLQALKSIASKMDLPVMIMSDDNQTESVMKATLHGACDYVMKPVGEDVLANIWQHIVRKKVMSKPNITPPVQSDLAQSYGFNQGQVGSMFVEQYQNIYQTEERAAIREWSGEIQPVQSDLVHEINVVDQHNEYFKTINQGNDQQNIERAATRPGITWNGETQPVQSDLVQINVVDQRTEYFKTICRRSIGQENIERAATIPGMTWNGEMQPFQPDLVQMNEYLYQHNDYSQTINQGNGQQSVAKNDEQAAKKPRVLWDAEEIQYAPTDLVQTDGFNNGNSVRNTTRRVERKKRRQRMIWTEDLHQKFLEAIDMVGGINKANPKVLLDCLRGMNIKGLTRNNLSSHLQKHRIYLEENQINQQKKETGWSTAYGAAALPQSFQGANNVNAAISPYLMNGPGPVNPIQWNQYQKRAVNPIQQNQLQKGAVNPNQQNQFQKGAVNPNQQYQQNQQYQENEQNQFQDGYMTMNTNPFITNAVSHFPNLDHEIHQPQQQQYQPSPQFNYGMSNEEPGQASDIFAPDLGLTYPSFPYM